MSLVGPRPLIGSEDELIAGWSRTRLDLAPGRHRPLAGARPHRHPVRGDGQPRLPLRDQLVAVARHQADRAHGARRADPARRELATRFTEATSAGDKRARLVDRRCDLRADLRRSSASAALDQSTGCRAWAAAERRRRPTTRSARGERYDGPASADETCASRRRQRDVFDRPRDVWSPDGSSRPMRDSTRRWPRIWPASRSNVSGCSSSTSAAR